MAKKVNVEFFENSKEVRFKRRFTAEQIIDSLAKFRYIYFIFSNTGRLEILRPPYL
jgi:hypothetical protein